jgi:transposase
MLSATLPDLNILDAEALKALIVTQHQHLVSTQDKLIATQEELRSRESEIEHLKLLIAKLHRMQFGRKSEKLGQQIEQLQLRLEELQANADAKEDPRSSLAVGTAAAKPVRHPLPDHLPRQTRQHEPAESQCPDCGGKLRKLGEDVFGDAGVRAGKFFRHSACASEAELRSL